MCIAPVNVPEVGLVACRYHCWQCRANRVNDYVGRCIAEQQTASGTLAVTLTYAGDVPNAATLVYADFQKFIKRLRRAGHRVRYIVAGEYGSKKGRAHWHAVLFFNGKVPDVPREKRVQWPFWPHGFSYFERPEYEGFAYVLKYALKDATAQVSTGHLSMSKKPPLGYAFFMDLAERHAVRGLSPQSPAYSFRDHFDSNGKRRRFWLQGRMRELYLERFMERFRRVHGRDYPFSELVEEHEDKLVREWRLANETDDEWRRRLDDRKPRRREPEAAPDLTPISYTVLPNEMLLVRYADGSARIETPEGDTWHVGDETELARALELLGLPPRLNASLSSRAAASSKRSDAAARNAQGEPPSLRQRREPPAAPLGPKVKRR